MDPSGFDPYSVWNNCYLCRPNGMLSGTAVVPPIGLLGFLEYPPPPPFLLHLLILILIFLLLITCVILLYPYHSYSQGSVCHQDFPPGGSGLLVLTLWSHPHCLPTLRHCACPRPLVPSAQPCTLIKSRREHVRCHPS